MTDSEGNKVIVNPGHMPYEYNRTYVPLPKEDSKLGNPAIEVMLLSLIHISKEGIRIKNWYETTIDPSTKRNLWGREIYPRCMLNTLREIRERYGDIDVYITENGHGCYETPDENGVVQDDERIEMMQGYIDYMFRAMEEGCPVRGYRCV